MLSLNFRLPKLNPLDWIYGTKGIDIKSVEIYDIELDQDKRVRTLKHLIKANHANHSIIFNNLKFHNHTPQILGSAFLVNANSEHLHKVYDSESKSLEPWRDSPGEISKDDWRDFLGKREYQRAYVDFFEDQLVSTYEYDWRLLMNDFLFEGKNPLINNLISGLGHPLIHLGYAYELCSPTVAIEALALGSCLYDFMHKYLDDPSYTKPSPYSSASPLDILHRIAGDKRLDGYLDSKGPDNLARVFSEREDVLLEHWNAWDLTNPTSQFEQSQQAAVALVVATHDGSQKYDFYLVHLLTTSHAIRILLPLIPAKFHVSLVRQWWLFTIAVYIAQLRPKIELKRIEEFGIDGKSWKDVDHAALESKWSFDAHFVKALRSIKVAAETWGDPDDFYLKAVVKFRELFDGWGG